MDVEISITSGIGVILTDDEISRLDEYKLDEYEYQIDSQVNDYGVKFREFGSGFHPGNYIVFLDTSEYSPIAVDGKRPNFSSWSQPLVEAEALITDSAWRTLETYFTDVLKLYDPEDEVAYEKFIDSLLQRVKLHVTVLTH